MKSKLFFCLIITIFQLNNIYSLIESPYNSNYYESLINLNSNEELIQNKFIDIYSLKGDERNFTFKYSNENNINEIIIKFHIYNGDINITTYFKNEYKINYYSNNIFLNIFLSQDIFETIIFGVKANENSYFSIFVEYQNKNEYTLQPGISYFIAFKDSISPIIKFENITNNYSNPFMVNLNSLNCKLEITNTKTNNIVTKYLDYYTYNIYDINDTGYDSQVYEYKIKVNKRDYTNYLNNLCTGYISGIELSKKYEDNIREIIIPDNIPQKIIFNNSLNHISYSYLHLDIEKDLIIKIILIYKAQYSIKLFFNNIEEQNYIINSNKIINIKNEKTKKYCKEINKICKITIDITLDKSKYKVDSMLEITVKSDMTLNPTYITKNLLKLDYI